MAEIIEKDKEQCTDELYRFYAMQTYAQGTAQFIATDFDEFTIEEATAVLETDHWYNQRIRADGHYTLFGDADHCTVGNGFAVFAGTLCETILAEYGLEIDPDTISFTKNDAKPGSYHYVIPRYFATCAKLREIHARIALVRPDLGIDAAIYTNHWFRCPNQSKGATPQRAHEATCGKHVIVQGEMRDFILGYIRPDALDISEVSLKTRTITLSDPSTSAENAPSDRVRDREIIMDFFDTCFKQARFDEYDSWLRTGMALKNTYGDDGFEMWRYFSRKSPRADTDEALRTRWATFRVREPSGGAQQITVATLYHYAREDSPEEYQKIISEHKMGVTDYDFAQYIKKYSNGRFIWNHGTLYCYNGSYWVADDRLMRVFINTELYDLLKPIAHDPKEINTIRSARRKDAIVRETQLILANDDIEFDANPDLVGFKNVVYDLKTHEFRNYRFDDYISQNTGYEWREPTDREIVTMRDIIASVFPRVPERELFLEILATGLSGHCIEKFIVFNGSGGNGKGLLDDLFLETIGQQYGMIGNNAILFERRRTGANPEIANLHKKRFVVFREIPPKVRFSNSVIKELTGGGNFAARGLYENATVKQLSLTLVVECNKRPLFAEEPEDADIRRIIDLQFAQRFTEDESKVAPERGVFRANPLFKFPEFQHDHRFAMFRIAAEAYRAYSARGFHFVIPENVALRTMEYLEMSSELIGWIHANYERTSVESDIVKHADMWDVFRVSSFFENMTRNEKKTYTRKMFYDSIESSALLRNVFVERNRKMDIRKHIVGFKKRATESADD